MNLLVSGCSFTKWGYKTWPDYIVDKSDKNLELIQLAIPGVGNNYICNSVIDTIISKKLTPENTFVMVMWSGISRHDLCVGKEFVDLILQDKRDFVNLHDKFYILSGGELGDWKNNSYTQGHFETYYKMTDKKCHLDQTVKNIIFLKSFLENNGFSYKFMSYTNSFSSKQEMAADDYTAYNCDPAFNLDSIIDANWIFADMHQNCLYEFAKDSKMLSDDDFHPITEAHEQFVELVIMPIIGNIL